MSDPEATRPAPPVGAQPERPRAANRMAVPARRKPGSRGAIYRRHIHLVAREEGVVVGNLVDDPHHFRVTLHHDGRVVSRIEGEAIRYPWTTCPGASDPLRALEGMPLSLDGNAVGSHTDPRANCTHMFDLAGLCVAHAASGRRERRYDCEAEDVPAEGSGPSGTAVWTAARVSRDGEPVFDWRLDGETIVQPERFAGVHIHRRFMAWAKEHLDAAEAEAAIVLRRACFVAPTRHFDLDTLESAQQLSRGMALCHSFSPENVHQARRMKGMQVDFAVPSPQPVQASEAHADALRARGRAPGGGRE